jgi:hypothetical protein
MELLGMENHWLDVIAVVVIVIIGIVIYRNKRNGE